MNIFFADILSCNVFFLLIIMLYSLPIRGNRSVGIRFFVWTKPLMTLIDDYSLPLCGCTRRGADFVGECVCFFLCCFSSCYLFSFLFSRYICPSPPVAITQTVWLLLCIELVDWNATHVSASHRPSIWGILTVVCSETALVFSMILLFINCNNKKLNPEYFCQDISAQLEYCAILWILYIEHWCTLEYM